MGFPVKVCSVCSVLVHVFILTQLTALGQEYSWDDSFDYIVVGGGTAGSVLAARLSEDPQHTVLLLEAGIDYEYILATDVPFAMPWLQDESIGINWGFHAERQEVACKSLINQQVLIPQGKILGGTSSINGMHYIRGSREDFDYWSYLGNEGWSYDEVLPYFMKSEHNMAYDEESRKYMNNSYHSWSGMWPVEKVVVYPELVEAFLDAHSDMGYMTTDLNGQNATGAMPSYQTSKRGRRMNTAKAFLKPVMYARDNLHVRTLHYVEKILLSGTTAKGVSVNDTLMNKMLHIEARKEVIVSAGAINSPKLLMLSGIGPINHLESLGIPVTANLPVGSHLSDHIMTDLSFEFNPKEGLTAQWWNIFSFDALQEYHFSGTGPWSSSGLQATSFFSLPEEEEDEEDEEDHHTTQQPHTVLEVLFSCNFENTSKSRKQVDGEVFDKSLDCAKLEQQTFVDDFNWTLWSGRTPSDGTGPSKDHTNNISDSGMYMYIEASGVSPYMNASLTSPFIYLEDGSQGMCLTFFYHMLGKHVGSLTVSEIESDEQIVKVWRVAKDDLVKSPGAVYGVDEWVSVSVNLSSQARAVRFTAMRGGTSPWHPFGDIAIDDIVIYRGACGVGSPSKKPDEDEDEDEVTVQPNSQTGSVTLLDCTFDSPSDQFCNFSQVMTGINDDLDWGRLNGGTPTSFTGPLHDHTQGNLSGYYIYVESSGVDPDKMAKIVTPELSGQQSHSMCLSFYYHMWGHNIGSLYVEEMHAGGSHVKVWEKKNNQLAVTEDGVYGSADWQSAEFDISKGTERVLFTAVKGGKPEEAELQPYGDIALDDIKIRTYPCNGAPEDNEETTTVATTTTTSAPDSSVLSCTFDGGWCGFSALDNRTWTLHSGATPTVNTGPREDHTKGNSSGKYLYAEATEKNPGERFNVRTPQLNSTGTAPLCLMFYYHMYGQHLGSLNVYEKHGDDAPSIVWIMTRDAIVEKSGQNDGWDLWLKAEAIIAPGTDYLIFSATRGGDDITEPYGDIAIDDVTVTEGVCESHPAESPYPVQKLVECDFDLVNDPPLCYKRQPSPADNEDQFDWRRRSGKTPSSFTGPLNDNSNHANGSYMYIEASGRSPNDSAILYISSPQLWMYTSGAACLTFHYHMYGKHIGGLYLYNVDQSNESNFLWEKDARHLIQINEVYGVDKWLEEELSVPARTTGFVFVGVRGGSTRGEPFGDIAIDDVLVTSGTCGQQASNAADVGNNGGGDDNNIEWVTEEVTQPTTPQSQTERPAMPTGLMIELIAMLMGNIPSNVTYVPNLYGFKPEVYTALHDQEANKYGAILLLSLQHPISQGSVRLSSTSPYDKPHIKLNYLQDQEDVKEMIRGVRFIQKLMQTSAFSELGAHYSTPHHPGCITREDQSAHIEFDSDEYWECYIRHNTLTNYHYTSTCRMGPHAEVAVVDRKLRVHGISNLRVVDASVMPKIISGNTMATTVMIAEKAADFIKQENEPIDEDENTIQVQGKQVKTNLKQRSMPGPYGVNNNINNDFEKSLEDAKKNLKQRSMPGPYGVDTNVKNDVEKSLEHLKTLLKNMNGKGGKR